MAMKVSAAARHSHLLPGLAVLAAGLVLPLAAPTTFSGAAYAQASQTPQAENERIYGSQLMTPQERSQYRQQLRQAQTVEERDRIRAQHHEEMQARAKERGLTLPDEPPAQGMGMGPGPGHGGGMMGPGGGPGSGGSMGPRGGGPAAGGGPGGR